MPVISNLNSNVYSKFEQIHAQMYNEYMLGSRKGKEGRWSKSDTLNELLENY